MLWPFLFATLTVTILSCGDTQSMYLPPDMPFDTGASASANDTDSDAGSSGTDEEAAAFAADVAAATCELYDECGYFGGTGTTLDDCVESTEEQWLETVTEDDCSFNTNKADECIEAVIAYDCSDLEADDDTPWWIDGDENACDELCD